MQNIALFLDDGIREVFLPSLRSVLKKWYGDADGSIAFLSADGVARHVAVETFYVGYPLGTTFDIESRQRGSLYDSTDTCNIVPFDVISVYTGGAFTFVHLCSLLNSVLLTHSVVTCTQISTSDTMFVPMLCSLPNSDIRTCVPG